MNAHTNNVQIINNSIGQPAFAVIPYIEYLSLIKETTPTIPHEVVGMVIKNEWNLVKAWRKHLGLTQKEVANKAGISQAALSQIEKAEVNNHTATLKKLAAAIGIKTEQLQD